MATKLKQICNGHRTHATKLLKKVTETKTEDKMVLQSLLIKKQQTLEKYEEISDGRG